MNPFNITFAVPGAAVPKGRPKFARRGNFVSTYTPEKTVSFENLVKVMAQQAMQGQDMHLGPVQASIQITLPIPSSWSGKRQSEAAAERIAPTKKPDMDNVVKALFDAMNGIVFKDDSQVVDAHIRKRYGRTPETLITIATTCQEAAK